MRDPDGSRRWFALAPSAQLDPLRTATAPDSRHEVVYSQWLPFAIAIALGLVLLPLQHDPIDGTVLGFALAAIGFVVLLGTAVVRLDPTPHWAVVVMPYAYLVGIALLREASGGARSGYLALMFLAPIWAALAGSRRDVFLVTSTMGLIQVVTGLGDSSTPNEVIARGAVLSTFVVGLIALGVHRAVSDLRELSAERAREGCERAQANDRLAASNAALAASNRDLEQVAYATSHDLQEPLRMIRSFSELFIERHGQELDDDGRELLGYVTDGAARAQALVADLLEYSRVGTSERPFVPVELDEVTHAALDVLAPAIAEVDGTVSTPDHLPRVLGDPAQLERLFVNLIGNAIKYRDPERTPHVEVTCTPVDDRIEIAVADNGIGFDEVHARRIFGMFQRLHPRDAYAGTGIGLAICARTVERHGGTIEVRSTPGVGSTFTFSLEAAPP